MSEDKLSYGEQIAADSNVTVYCSSCKKKIEFDPTHVVESERPLGARFVCTSCGERGLCIVSPKWRPNTFGEMIPYGATPKLSDGFMAHMSFIGPPRAPVTTRRRKRR